MNESLERIFEMPVANRVAILLVSLGLIGLFYWLYFLSPVNDKLSSLDKAINGSKGLKVQIAEQEGIAQNLDKFKVEVRRLDVELDKALEELPDKKEVAALLSRISDKARDAGLDIKLFKPQGIQKKDFYAEVPVEIEVSGSFHQVATFFDEVGHLARIVNLNSFRLSTPLIDEDQVSLSTSVVATAFRFLDESERVVKKKGNKKKRKAKKRKAS